MIIEPKVRGFICTAAHPEGCAQNVADQIAYVRDQVGFSGPKNVLVIGASTGYGLASRIVSAFGCGAKTIGVFFEKPAQGKRTATAGWYNTVAFEQEAKAVNIYAKSINGDAFSTAIKEQTIDLIKSDFGQVDLVIYSLAAPRRTDPQTGETYSSTLKTVGDAFTSKTVDPIRYEVKDVSIEPASQDDIEQTVRVMGGEDWTLWMEALHAAGVLSDEARTVAYSYIGPELTHAVYKNGTIGRAKDHLQSTADALNTKMQSWGNGRAFISVNKSVVTQASSAIPVVPLYISILFKLMKASNTHEGCIEQIYRLYRDFLYNPNDVTTDESGRIRIDDLEMNPKIQEQVADIWNKVDTSSLKTLTDIDGYVDDFYHLFGFNRDDIDYKADTDPNRAIPSLEDSA